MRVVSSPRTVAEGGEESSACRPLPSHCRRRQRHRRGLVHFREPRPSGDDCRAPLGRSALHRAGAITFSISSSIAPHIPATAPASQRACSSLLSAALSLRCHVSLSNTLHISLSSRFSTCSRLASSFRRTFDSASALLQTRASTNLSAQEERLRPACARVYRAPSSDGRRGYRAARPLQLQSRSPARASPRRAYGASTTETLKGLAGRSPATERMGMLQAERSARKGRALARREEKGRAGGSGLSVLADSRRRIVVKGIAQHGGKGRRRAVRRYPRQVELQRHAVGQNAGDCDGLKPAQRRRRVGVLPSLEPARGARHKAVETLDGRRVRHDDIVKAAQRDGLVEAHADAAAKERPI